MTGVVETAPPEGGDRPSARADAASALFWVTLGAGIIAGAWNMDRFESQGGSLYSMPGLVPGLLGAMLVLLGALLGIRSLRTGALKPGQPPLLPGWNPRLLAALGFMLAYALGLVGRVPFWLGTFVFVAGFIAAFEWHERGGRNQRARGLLVAILCGACTSAIVAIVFERVFLVRLP